MNGRWTHFNVKLHVLHFPRQSNFGVEVTRLLERCIKESRCVDTESLCIMAGVKVNTFINVLHHILISNQCGIIIQFGLRFLLLAKFSRHVV